MRLLSTVHGTRAWRNDRRCNSVCVGVTAALFIVFVFRTDRLSTLDIAEQQTIQNSTADGRLAVKMEVFVDLDPKEKKETITTKEPRTPLPPSASPISSITTPSPTETDTSAPTPQPITVVKTPSPTSLPQTSSSPIVITAPKPTSAGKNKTTTTTSNADDTATPSPTKSPKTTDKKKKKHHPSPLKEDERGTEKVRCPSLYRVGNRTEHSPLLFRKDAVVVCRTPKVGSTLLRSISEAYEWNETKISYPEWKWLNGTNRLSNISNVAIVNAYLFGDVDARDESKSVHRVLFARHPVTRILAGYLQITSPGHHSELFWTEMYGFDQDYGYDPDSFWKWLTESNFTQEYHESCDNYVQYTLDAKRQHYLPPQQCRCGKLDCGIQWDTYRIEDSDMLQVMAKYLPGSSTWLLTERNQRHSHLNTKEYEARDYLVPKVLKLLNKLTKKEQEYFGYKPYTLDDVKAAEEVRASTEQHIR